VSQTEEFLTRELYRTLENRVLYVCVKYWIKVSLCIIVIELSVGQLILACMCHP
jgi:hypothetical protein